MHRSVLAVPMIHFWILSAQCIKNLHLRTMRVLMSSLRNVRYMNFIGTFSIVIMRLAFVKERKVYWQMS